VTGPARRARIAGSDRALLPPWLRRLAAYCLAVLVVVLTVWVATQALVAVPLVTIAVAVALLLSALLRPLVDLVERAGVPPWLGALGSLLALLGVLAGSLYWVTQRVLHQLDDLQGAITSAVDDLRRLLTSPPLSLDPQQVTQVRNAVVDYLQQAAPSPMTGATLVLQLLAAAVFVVFVLFFLLKDGPAMWRWALRWVPAHRRDRTDGAASCAWTTLTSYVRGTVVVAFVDAVGIGATLFLLGVPLAASLTLLTFLGAFVPIVGATVSGALAVVVTLVTQGATDAVIVLAVVLAVQQLEGNVLQPLVMGHAVQLHPVVIAIAVTVGGLLAGIAGAVVAVPVVAVSYRVVDYLARQRGETPAQPGTSAPAA
jgi:predicted PurR-regulated permease PerM